LEAIITPRPGTGSTNTDVGGQDGPGGGHQAVPGCLLLREEEVVSGHERRVGADQRGPDHEDHGVTPPDTGEKHGDDGDAQSAASMVLSSNCIPKTPTAGPPARGV